MLSLLFLLHVSDELMITFRNEETSSLMQISLLLLSFYDIAFTTIRTDFNEPLLLSLNALLHAWHH